MHGPDARAQTPGELKGRTERMEGFPDLAAVADVLDRLIDRGFVVRHPRRPGQKEDRFQQVLGGEDLAPASASATTPAPSSPTGGDGPKDDRVTGEEELLRVAEEPSPAEAAAEAARLDRLEADLLELKGEIARLREALGD